MSINRCNLSKILTLRIIPHPKTLSRSNEASMSLAQTALFIGEVSTIHLYLGRDLYYCYYYYYYHYYYYHHQLALVAIVCSRFKLSQTK